MAAIGYRELTKVFDDGTVAVDAFSLEIADGEFVVLVGPSGSGKTTVLRMTAGLERPTRGEVRIGEEIVNDVDPQDRNIAMVFQNYALYPHMTVYDNMGFGLRLHGMKKREIRDRVEPAAEMLGLSTLLKRKPAQLSGGQRQRVAMGRAIVREPDAFLMDEPLSNLDAKLRVEMRSYVALLHQRLRTTTLYVTHDQIEAMTMGDRVAVMRDGRLKQVAEPQELYERPVNLFVAGFIGSPAMNLLRSRLTGSDEGFSVDVGTTKLRLPESLLEERPALRGYVDRDVIVGIRPEDIEDAAFVPGANGAALDVTIALAEPMGSEVIAHFAVPGQPVVDTPTVGALLGPGEDGDAAEYLALTGGRDGSANLTAKLTARTRARAGDAIRVAIDAAHLHFFDPETEAAIR